MQDRTGNTIDEESYRFFTQKDIDAILREGARHGRNGSHAAIERILRHEPQLERAELWRRIRRLKERVPTAVRHKMMWSTEDEKLLRTGYESGIPKNKRAVIRELLKRHPDWSRNTIWKRARRLHLTLRMATNGQQCAPRPWSKANDRKLLNLAGESKPAAIAEILHRSERAVRCRLAWLGESTRVHNEGYARRSIAEELHLGRRTVQRFIVEGLLEVRDPRVTKRSITELKRSGKQFKEGRFNHNASSAVPPAPEICSRAKRVWAAAAAKLNVTLAAVEKLIVNGTLKLCDPRITEDSFERFCHKYGALIEQEFLNQETRRWLRSSMNLNRDAGIDAAKRLAASREHALTVRKCEKCGRLIRGNVFFKHLKDCRATQNGKVAAAPQADRLRSNEPVSA
jgi:hypothetical protein